MNGAVIYRGPSALDGKPIVVIATGLKSGSNNEKTGDLIQTWIMREDLAPTDAIKTGEDASICGDCPHRGKIEDGRNVGRSCYVAVFQAPLTVWKTFQRGGYPDATAMGAAQALFTGRKVRLGSYGDPAAVPLHVWHSALAKVKACTGYTHQWRKAAGLSAYCMASCDSANDATEAKACGFRTFRVTALSAPADKRQGEVVCPASAEAGFKTTCSACLACGGHSAKAKASIVITVHGVASKIAAARSFL